MDLSKLSVLVVEDSPGCQAEFDKHVREWGCKDFTVLRDVPSAILRTKQRMAELIPYDLVLCNQEFHSETSNRTGQDLLEEIRTKWYIGQETAFVMVAGSPEYEKRAASATIKPDGVCSKLGTKSKTHLDEVELEKVIRSSISKRKIIVHVTELLREKKYQEARKICKACLRKEKKYVDDIRNYLAIAQSKLEELKMADMAIREGEFLFYEEKPEEAFVQMRKVITDWSEYSRGYMIFAEMLADTDDIKGAQRMLEHWLQTWYGDTEYMRFLANVAYENDDYTTAQEQFKAIINGDKDKKNTSSPEDFLGLAMISIAHGRIERIVKIIEDLEERFGDSEYASFCIACIEMHVAKYKINKPNFEKAYTKAKAIFFLDGNNLPLSENLQLEFMRASILSNDDDMAEIVLRNLMKKTDRLIGLENRVKKLPASFQNNNKVRSFLKEVAGELHEESLLLVKEGKLNEAVKQTMKAVEKFEDEEILKKSIIILTSALRREWNEFYYRTAEKYYAKLEDLRTNDIHLHTGAINRIHNMYAEKIEALRKNDSKKSINKVRDERGQERLPLTNEADIVTARKEPNFMKDKVHLKANIYRIDDRKVEYHGYIRDISDGGFSISCDTIQEHTPDFETYDQVMVEVLFHGKQYKATLAVTSAIHTTDALLRIGGYYVDTDHTPKKDMTDLNAKIRGMIKK